MALAKSSVWIVLKAHVDCPLVMAVLLGKMFAAIMGSKRNGAAKASTLDDHVRDGVPDGTVKNAQTTGGS